MSARHKVYVINYLDTDGPGPYHQVLNGYGRRPLQTAGVREGRAL